MGISLDLSSHAGRKQLVEQIAHSENVKRKAFSLRQTQIYSDQIYDHVYDSIVGRFSAKTARQMPICAHINLARRIVKAEASIYKQDPKRSYSEITDNQKEVIELIYDDMMINTKLMRSNESFKLQQQNHIMIVPKDGKLMMRVLRNHHIDALPDEDNPEEAYGYVIHNFDRTFFDQNRKADNNEHSSGKFNTYTNQRNDAVNQVIGDEDDWKSETNRYLVWTKEHNFIMNGKGEIISEIIDSPIKGTLPIIDISQEKDFTYWVNQGDAIIDATLDYNVTMSDVGHIVQNQGFAQAYLISERTATPDNMQIGPNQIIHLPVDEGDQIRPEFGFAQPGSDITGALQYANDKLMAFLTSRGLDPDDIVSTKSGGGASNSGVQEFLRMMKHFKASKEDYDTYERAEDKIYRIIKAWHNEAPNLLNDEYKTSFISDDSKISLEFSGPEMLQTEQERVDVIISKMDNGLMSRLDALMELENLDKNTAMERLKEIDESNNDQGDDVGDQEQRPADNEEIEAGLDRDTEEQEG